MKKLTLVLVSLTTSLSASEMPNRMGVAGYAMLRSVKVCTGYKHSFPTCGTGVFIGPGKILTNAHVVPDSTYSVKTDSSGVLDVITESGYLLVLKSGDMEFQKAVVRSSSTELDLAVITIEDKVNPSVLFNHTFRRGQKVYSIGNPAVEDFKIVDTEVIGVFSDLDLRGNPRSMVMVDSQEGEVTHGFSGGGIWDVNGGLLGITQYCFGKENFCAAIAAKDIEKYLQEVK